MHFPLDPRVGYQGPAHQKYLRIINDSPGFGDVIQAVHLLPSLQAAYDGIYADVQQPLDKLVRYSLGGGKFHINESCPGNPVVTKGWFQMLKDHHGSQPPGERVFRVPPDTPHFPMEYDEVYHVGISWRTHERQIGNCRRTIFAAPLIERLLRIPNVRLHGLQPDHVEDLSDYPQVSAHRFRDFSDTARLISQLDCVVTIDGVIGHLAGALGVHTYILLNSKLIRQDWMHVGPGTDGWWTNPRAGFGTTPWYPSVELMWSNGEKASNDPNGLIDAVDQVVSAHTEGQGFVHSAFWNLTK